MLRLRTEWKEPTREDVLAALPEAKSVSLARLHVRLLRRGFDIPPKKLTARLRGLRDDGFVTLERHGRWWLWKKAAPSAIRKAVETKAQALAASKEKRAASFHRWVVGRMAQPEYRERLARIIELRKQGWTYARIGEAIGCAKSTVIGSLQRVRALFQVEVNTPTGTIIVDPRQEPDKLADRKAAFRRGVENRRTGPEYEARVARIVALREQGWAYPRIGAEVGLCRRAVGRTIERVRARREARREKLHPRMPVALRALKTASTPWFRAIRSGRRRRLSRLHPIVRRRDGPRRCRFGVEGRRRERRRGDGLLNERRWRSRGCGGNWAMMRVLSSSSFRFHPQSEQTLNDR